MPAVTFPNLENIVFYIEILLHDFLIAADFPGNQKRLILVLTKLLQISVLIREPIIFFAVDVFECGV